VNAQGDTPPKFLLGRVAATKNALKQIPIPEIFHALHRHERGDWGQLERDDWDANENSLKHGGRLVSRFLSTANVRFWIITEWDHNRTTVLLPEDH
jgi:hypothetical protein